MSGQNKQQTAQTKCRPGREHCYCTTVTLSHCFMLMQVIVNTHHCFKPVFASAGASHDQIDRLHSSSCPAVSLSARLPAHLLFVLCKGLWVHAFFKGDGAFNKINGRLVFLTFSHFELHRSESAAGVFFPTLPYTLYHACYLHMLTQIFATLSLCAMCSQFQDFNHWTIHSLQLCLLFSR